MTAVYIILGIAAALFLLSLLRVGVHIAFGDELRVTAMAGPVRVQLLPKPDKPEKEKTKKEKPSGEKKPEDGKKKERKLDLTKEDLRTALPAAWEALKKGLGKTRQRLRIDPMQVSAVLGGAIDPAGTAELYGYINAGMWTVMPQLERLTRMPDPRIHTEIDFNAERTKVSGQVGLSLQIRDLFTIGWAFAGPMVKWFMAMRKRRKAAEKAGAAAKAAAEKEARQASGQGAGYTTT